MSAKDTHSKGTHTFIGVGAAAMGVVLGIGVVYWDGMNDKEFAAQAQAVNADCIGGDYDRKYQYPQMNKETSKQSFVNKTCYETTPAGVCTGKCQIDGMCRGDACNGKKLEGKPKEEPKEEGKGGEMPKLPELPKGGGGGEPPPPTDPTKEECKKEPKPADCPSKGISGLLGNLFGTAGTSSGTGPVQSTIQSVADKLSSFLSGGESSPTVDTSVPDTDTSATTNPTQAVVTPVTPSASNAAQVTSDTKTGSTEGPPSSGSSGSSQSVVTGFNAGVSADVNSSTGPILSAIRSVTSRIQEILSALF
ncbi:MAG: hypothetical protein WAZ27_00175 [Minisyncoccia bacterium]